MMSDNGKCTNRFLRSREIGCCERALGDMLEWRLWVIKSIAPREGTRSVARSYSVSGSELRSDDIVADIMSILMSTR
jgi:hypothetical protein